MGSIESRLPFLPHPNAADNECSEPCGAMMATVSSEVDCWDDSDLHPVLDLMCYFCWSLKPSSKFHGAVHFIILPPDHSSHHSPLEFTIVVEQLPEQRVLIYEGAPPPEFVNFATVLCPYSLFWYVYRPTGGLVYMTKSVTSQFLRRKVKATNFSCIASFAKSFEFTTECWAGFHAKKARLQRQSAWPEVKVNNVGLESKYNDHYFSSAAFFRREKDDNLVCEAPHADLSVDVNVKQAPTPDSSSFMSMSWPAVDPKPAILNIVKSLQEGVDSYFPTNNDFYTLKEKHVLNSTIVQNCTQISEQYFDYDVGDWHGMGIGAQNSIYKR